MQYMVIEHFRGGDARGVYRRFREQGREVVPVITSAEAAAAAE